MPERVMQEVVLRGLAVSKGVGIGSAIFLHTFDDPIPEVMIAPLEIEEEIDRYRKALDLSRKDVETLHQISIGDGPQEVTSILGTHLAIMQDPLLTNVIEDKIRDTQKNTETVFKHIIDEYKVRFSTLSDSYFQERVKDIIDVSRRILGHLRPTDQLKMSQLPQNSIVLAHELVPSDTVEASPSIVSAFVTGAGGITSHAAIIARAKGIPYVANIDLKELKKHEIQTLIVDGSQGIVILNPLDETLKKYQKLQFELQHVYKKLKDHLYLKAETIDGYEVRIFANLENPSEIDDLILHKPEGIGLFRSEYLFLSSKSLPSEEEQVQIYKHMLDSLAGKPLVVRVFDVGGEKKVDLPMHHPDAKYFHSIGHELNPALGCRAIRFLLRFPEILKTQIRAILRSSVYGEVHILIPMISDLSEIEKVKLCIDEVKKELISSGFDIADSIPVGCMIEVPSTAIMSDKIAEEVDFLSIGTNDLVQYVMAADRSNFNTADLHHIIHPSVLRLIRMVVSSANKARKPLILCGECATDPMMIPLLIGLGIREFSVAARHIPIVKHTIRKWRILEACSLAESALEYSSVDHLKEFLSQEALR